MLVRSFNPCFRGTRPRTQHPKSSLVAILKVSILVFVEPALGRYRILPAHVSVTEFQSLFSWNPPSDLLTSSAPWLPPCRFNPCFRGTRPRTLRLKRKCNDNLAVSILVFVEPALGRRIVMSLQPLSWSFNPCFRGTRPRTYAISYSVHPRFAFQSLFSWNPPSDSGSGIELLPGCPGFNPCFRGTRPRTLLAPIFRFVSSLFQSLFSWNPPSDFEPYCDKFTRARFNPCFRGTRPRTCWRRRANASLQGGFQSLFSWNPPSDDIRWPGRFRPTGVSILVFVEPALGPRNFVLHILKDDSFNPCFRGTRPRTRGAK
jgi:uncharacterized protein (DUF433 family)